MGAGDTGKETEWDVIAKSLERRKAVGEDEGTRAAAGLALVSGEMPLASCREGLGTLESFWDSLTVAQTT